jgi:DNA polymerase-3 subunit gamma/tau
MAAQALYLKYRPQTFEELAGQEPITRTLRNALRQGRIRHAYLFTGPRGTGKTTTARLLAKAVNCQAPEGERPCNECSICVAINEGRLLDLIEIDAASNRGIDEIRDIREKVAFRPNEGRYKVYVLDEAHMLTEPAFNALLKTLEEPPPHVIFTLVTTDPHKIPATIASRCQRFDFRHIPLRVVVDRLAYIAEQEAVTVEPDALELIAHHGTGAMRDAISLLDQLTSYGDEITLDQVQMVLGTVASEAAGKLVDCLVDGDVAGGLDLINRTVGDGADPRQFGREVVEVLRGLLLVREGAGTRVLNVTAEQAAEMEDLAKRVTVDRLLRAIHLFNEAATDLRRGLQTIPQLPLEMALVESSLPSEALQPTGQAVGEPQSLYQVPAQPASPSTRAEVRQPVEQASPSRAATSADLPPAAQAAASAPTSVSGPTLAASSQVEAPVARQRASGTQPAAQVPSGALTLGQVEQAWGLVLQAVRQRNPATQAVLNTGCQPVEVDGDEIVVTFPYPVLREKLVDPQRRAEIQDALTEVLQARCRVKLVLAAEYKPRRQPSPQPRPAPPESPPSEAAPDAQAAEDDLPEAISRWAAQHGGEAKIVP